MAVVILTEDVGRKACRSGAWVALPSGSFSLWGTEDPDPGCHETNTGRATLSDLQLQLALWPVPSHSTSAVHVSSEVEMRSLPASGLL